MRVELELRASDDLLNIWTWNATKYSPRHAKSYLDFLESELASLEHRFSKGKPVPTRPDYWYITARKGRRGAGHVIVYLVEMNVVRVIGVFHTAQDWQAQL